MCKFSFSRQLLGHPYGSCVLMGRPVPIFPPDFSASLPGEFPHTFALHASTLGWYASKLAQVGPPHVVFTWFISWKLRPPCYNSVRAQDALGVTISSFLLLLCFFCIYNQMREKLASPLHKQKYQIRCHF